MVILALQSFLPLGREGEWRGSWWEWWVQRRNWRWTERGTGRIRIICSHAVAIGICIYSIHPLISEWLPAIASINTFRSLYPRYSRLVWYSTDPRMAPVKEDTFLAVGRSWIIRCCYYGFGCCLWIDRMRMNWWKRNRRRRRRRMIGWIY